MSTGQSLEAGQPESGGTIDPVLAKLYHARAKFERESESDNTTRAVLCNDLSRVLHMSPRATEREMAADILISLLRHADMILKCALAERLSTLEHVPLRLLLQLVSDGITVAEPVIKSSPVLNDLDLLYIIQSRDAAYWRVIAQRINIGENVVDALADTGDIQTAKNLAENKTIQFSRFALKTMEEVALADIEVASIFVARPDIPKELSARIYAIAGARIQKMVGDKYTNLAFEVRENIDDVILEFSERGDGDYVPTSAMLRAADMFMKEGKLNTALMTRTLARGQVSSFIAQFSAFAALPVAVVMGLFQQRDRHGLAIVCRAMGFERHIFEKILILTRLVAVKTAPTSDDIGAAMEYFDRVSIKAAQRLLNKTRH
jgi:uncharacterized protein (DUF2336 family)